MEDETLPLTIVLASLLALSAYFSGSETAFFSLSRLEQDSLRRRASSRRRGMLDTILSSPDEVLITILTGNMLVNVIAATLGERMGERLFPTGSELYSIIGMTVALLLIGEMTPKNLAVRHSHAFAQVAAVPLYYIYHALTPLRWFLNLFNRVVRNISPDPSVEATGEPRIILSAVKIGFREGILDQAEHNLFESYVKFRSKTAGEVMIPRTELQGIELSTPISKLIRDTPRWDKIGTLLPVYRKDLDHLLGYMDLRELLPFKYGLKKGERLRSLMKPFISVPVSKNCAELMAEMRENKAEMALVVDEYGGTAGMITFHGLLEILFSYFYPEKQEALIELGHDCYNVPGNMEIETLKSVFGQELPTESRTVAGLITGELGEIPGVGTRLTRGDLQFTVRKIARNRILSVEVRRLPGS